MPAYSYSIEGHDFSNLGNKFTDQRCSTGMWKLTLHIDCTVAAVICGSIEGVVILLL